MWYRQKQEVIVPLQQIKNNNLTENNQFCRYKNKYFTWPSMKVFKSKSVKKNKHKNNITTTFNSIMLVRG